jgi:creatinine amidohydrolase
MHIERMTSPAVQAALDDGVTTAIVACGAVEQHGPHLPLFMDAEHGAALAEAVAERLGNALVAPAVRVGCSEHHMRFPGSMTVRLETFEAICTDYAESLSRHGFHQVLFIPTHGGNYGPLAALAPRLDQRLAPATRVRAFTDLAAQIRVWERVVEEMSGLGDRVGGHADIAETSIMLALHPELVDVERAAEGYRGALTPDVLQRVFNEGIGAVTPNGILGDARGASAEMGRRCMEATAEMVAEWFRART